MNISLGELLQLLGEKEVELVLTRQKLVAAEKRIVELEAD